MKVLFLGLIACVAAISFAAQTETKLITEEETFATAVYRLGDTIVKEETRKVYFADNENFDFHAEGIIFRIRTKKGKLQSTVKLRNLSPELFAEYSKLTFSSKLDYKCEMDQAVGKQVKRSCSLSATFKEGKVKKAEDFFTKKQVGLVADHVGKSNKKVKKLLEKMKVLGPISSRVYRFSPEGLGVPDEVDFVHWSLNGEDIYEVSARGVDVAQKFENFIDEYDLYDLSSHSGITKTKWAMQLFGL